MFSQFFSHILFPATESLNEVLYHHLVGHKVGNPDPIMLQVYWTSPRSEQHKFSYHAITAKGSGDISVGCNDNFLVQISEVLSSLEKLRMICLGTKIQIFKFFFLPPFLCLWTENRGTTDIFSTHGAVWNHRMSQQDVKETGMSKQGAPTL